MLASVFLFFFFLPSKLGSPTNLGWFGWDVALAPGVFVLYSTPHLLVWNAFWDEGGRGGWRHPLEVDGPITQWQHVFLSTLVHLVTPRKQAHGALDGPTVSWRFFEPSRNHLYFMYQMQ